MIDKAEALSSSTYCSAKGTVSATHARNTDVIGTHLPDVEDQRNSSRHLNPVIRIIAKLKARMHYNSIKKSLKEVELIEAGKIRPKSLDQLLNEL